MATKKLTKLGARRLLRLAKTLDEAHAKQMRQRRKNKLFYDQTHLQHSCGAPACAWGEYVFSLGERRRMKLCGIDAAGFLYVAGIDDADEEFGITFDEAYDIFSSYGCNNAQTAAEAAAYIRAFVKRKGVECT